MTLYLPVVFASKVALHTRKKCEKLLRKIGVVALLTPLFWSIDWFVRLYEHHPVSIAQKNLGFLMKLIMCVIRLGYQIYVLFIHRRGIWQVSGFYL